MDYRRPHWASIAHEVNQPLTAITNNGNACLRLLANHNLDPAVLHEVLGEIVADSTRASAVISRIRGFIKKAPAEKSPLNINEVIQEVLDLAAHEIQKTSLGLRQRNYIPDSGENDVGQTRGYHPLPTKLHQLIVAISRPGPAKPHISVDQEHNLAGKNNDAGQGVKRRV